jgi:hypothetical protein
MKQLPYARAILERIKSEEKIPHADKLYIVIGPDGWEEDKLLTKQHHAYIRLFPDMKPEDYDWSIVSRFEMVIIIAPTVDLTEIPAAYCLQAGARLALARNYDCTDFMSYWPERRGAS